MYSNETRTRLVKERIRKKECQRRRCVRSGGLILTALVVGAALGAAVFCPAVYKRKGDKYEKGQSV